jgi:hypothetical protein
MPGLNAFACEMIRQERNDVKRCETTHLGCSEQLFRHALLSAGNLLGQANGELATLAIAFAYIMWTIGTNNIEKITSFRVHLRLGNRGSDHTARGG